ncbi:4-formylbenzenesulfonate dehydrogenase TsaC1/TsaC2 [compost metagenome]
MSDNKKVVLVTGGSSGIGFAIAQEFVAIGAQVVITGLYQDELDVAAGKLGHGVAAIRANIADGAEMDAVFAQVAKRHGQLDAVIANAGAIGNAPLGQINEEHIKFIFGTNINGLVNTVQKALPLMVAGGSIVVIGSAAATRPSYGLSVYSASKAAMRTLLQTWVFDTRGSGVRINMISPWGVDTPGLRAALAVEAGPDGVEAALEYMAKANPLGRVTQPKDIANVAVYLASEQASFIHGVDLLVDGGATQV